jgi:hypothetical protein
LEQATQIYKQSTCDTSIKQAVESLLEASYVDHTFLKIFKHSHVDRALLVEGAIQTALNNLLCMISHPFFFIFNEY